MLTRRRLLALLATGSAAALSSACGVTPEAEQSSGGAYCVARSTLDAHRTLGDLPLVYEVNERRSSFSFEPGFYAQLDGWLRDYVQTSGLRAPDEVRSYGGWTDGGNACDSWHNAGRAFDLAGLRRSDETLVSCRYDQWQAQTGAALERSLRSYWALAASLHRQFSYVLTYLYNPQHHNHIHVDNGRSGAGPSTLSTRSTVQVQALQAICTHLWDTPVEITGRWDQDTRRATRQVLDRLEISADLDEGDDAWSGFLAASTSRGGDS